MKKFPSEKNRIRVNITFDPDVYERLKEACGYFPVSRRIEELVSQWLESQEKKSK